jgi:cell division protein FtsL
VITTIVTFLTEKIVAVVITTVIVVAAVPTLIVAINGNTITITTAAASSTRKHDDEERARLILQVKTAGDSVVVNINHEEASCDSQIDQLAAVSTLAGSATKTALDNGKAKFHTSAAPLLKEIKDDEDEFDHLNVITTETTQTFLVRISNVQVTAFGTDGSGVLITTCQTILVEIRQVIVIVVQKPGGGEGDDLKVKA